ncbi:hypothetical protein [Streptomyces sp. NRRL S-495]|uniref:hypothetical protein n=1 Tax=Streptomyces sp. NRRL S-495 TaxID=1609133 RepID=UPI0025705941|nr:hypothetical protein [Streptomyces sp. NRRL S-495]
MPAAEPPGDTVPPTPDRPDRADLPTDAPRAVRPAARAARAAARPAPARVPRYRRAAVLTLLAALPAPLLALGPATAAQARPQGRIVGGTTESTGDHPRARATTRGWWPWPVGSSSAPAARASSAGERWSPPPRW